jgi:diguanylate cyclase
MPQSASEPTRPAGLAGDPATATQHAKAALRRLALDKLEPTPDNYARAYAREAGRPAANDGAAIAGLIERVVRGLERGSKGWTSARKKESLQRVLDGSRSDARRLQQRLSQLVGSWDTDPTAAAVGEVPGETAAEPGADESTGAGDSGRSEPALRSSLAEAPMAATESPATEPAEVPGAADLAPAWSGMVNTLVGAVGHALPEQGDAPHEIAQALAALAARIRTEGPSAPLIEALESLCQRAAIVLQHRHHLLDQLGALCGELTASLTDLAENDSWAQGQVALMRDTIDEGLSARGVRAVSELLRDTRERHGQVRAEREQARDSLKGMIHLMLSELDELGSQTGNFHASVGRYAEVIANADSLESLAGMVREMVLESRSVQALVQQTQARLHAENDKARGLAARVDELETEMRRLSDEVTTDPLTRIANRRGLAQAFDVLSAGQQRSGCDLLVGLLDIDNFKRLNDELGHSVGDEALKALAAVVAETLRPTDMVARYGGEEFVVLLPDTPLDEGQQILTRLQRSLTGGLFLHEQRKVLVTFSAGVTAYREGERIETALERADQGLYEAKRTGKNRTCLA